MTAKSKPSQRGRILIVEDDRDMAALLKSSLCYEGFRCDTAHSIEETKTKLEQYSYDAVLLDLFLGEESGLEFLPYITNRSPFSKVIVITGQGSIDMAVGAMERGATTFLTKSGDPGNITEEVKKRLIREEVDDAFDADELAETIGIIGKSAAVQKVIRNIDRIKDADATVLIHGDSGTGKELVARAIHLLSTRRRNQFEAINCSAIPENLLETELFGHTRGAFTDAKSARQGIFEVCSNGTLFLDEIGEMPIHLQAKILRVLQEREVRPVGASQSIPINTRVVAATNRDLEEEVKSGRFRGDLFFRLSVIPIYVPSLSERREDIPLLVDYFIRKFNDRYQRSVSSPAMDVRHRLMNHDWPGNIRELQNCIERAVVMSNDGHLHLEDVFLPKIPRKDSGDHQNSASMPLSYATAKQSFEKGFLQRILTTAGGNISEAARISGRFRSDIYRLMEKYKIHQDDYKIRDQKD